MSKYARARGTYRENTVDYGMVYRALYYGWDSPRQFLWATLVIYFLPLIFLWRLVRS